MRKDQSGFITIEFLFSIMLTLSASVLVFIISFTLTVVEVVQYAMYSTTRSYIASHKAPEDQVNAAAKKYSELLEDPESPLSVFFRNGWFTISPSRELDIRGGPSSLNGKDFDSDFGEAPNGVERRYNVGISTTLKANLLNLKLPFLGTTSNGETDDFETHVSTFLIRDPSSRECMDGFMKKRGDSLVTLPSGEHYSAKIKEAYEIEYKAMEDNGC